MASTDASGHVAAGNDAFVMGDFPAAEQAFSKAVEAGVSNALGRRGAAYLHMRNFTDAIDDLAAAFEAEPSTGVHAYRLGIAYFMEEEFEAAQAAFTKATASGVTVTPAIAEDCGTWLLKCQACLDAESGSDEEEEEEEEAVEAPAPVVPVPAVAPPPVVPVPAPTAAGPSPGSRKFGWFQTPETVSVRFFLSGAAQTGHDIDIEDGGSTLSVCLARTSGAEFQFDLTLFAPVYSVPGSITVSVEAAAVEVTLTKKTAVQWPSLGPATKGGPVAMPAMTPPATAGGVSGATHHGLGTVQAAADVAAASAACNVYPTSNPRAKGKNWDQIEAELAADDEKPQGEAALQALFRQIYSKADPDTRRAMVKSFQTSGGTVLSTNWQEVAAKDYETERPAPAGMEWKKNEQ